MSVKFEQVAGKEIYLLAMFVLAAAGWFILFPFRRSLAINFLQNHAKGTFAFNLGISKVGKQAAEQQQGQNVLKNPANDFHALTIPRARLRVHVSHYHQPAISWKLLIEKHFSCGLIDLTLRG